MHPAVSKVYLHTVNVIYLLILIHLLHLLQYGINVGLWCQVDSVLSYEIVGELSA